jgi:hypothetical protein
MQNYWDTGFIPKIPYRVDYSSYWDEPDSRENFLSKPKPGYTETSIHYKCNSYGYRTPEFDFNSTNPSIFCLGCSFTYGTGVALEHTWPYLVQQAFPNYTVHNFGSAGASGDTILRTLTNIGNMLNPKIVLIFWPEIFRFELYNENFVWYASAADQHLCASGIVIDSHWISLRRKNKAMLGLLADKYDYKVIEYATRNIPVDISNRGRDNHPGPVAHANIANLYISRIKNDLGI